MAAASGQTCCVICGKGKATLKCGGCLQDFCYNHVADHRQELNRQLDEIEVNRDVFRQALTDQSTDPKKPILMRQINEWEHASINKIRQTAEEARQLVMEHTIEHISQIEVKLNKLTGQIRQSREENDFFETDINQWKGELKRLTKDLDIPSNIQLLEDSAALVKKIYVNVTSAYNALHSISIRGDTEWIQNGFTVAAGNGEGSKLNQLNDPTGIYVDDDQTIYIADQFNHRIVEWKSGTTSGKIVAGGNGQGNRTDQLNCPIDIIVAKESDRLIICDRENSRVVCWPRRNGIHGETIMSDIACSGLTMDDNSFLYVSDTEKNEVRRFRIGDTRRTIVAGGNGGGNRLDQLNFPTHLFIDHEYSVYVSDTRNHRVLKWMKDAKEGIVVAGGRGKGNTLEQLSSPCGLTVDHLGNVYVADTENHRIMRWSEGAKQGTVVAGGNGKGTRPNRLDRPTGLSFDRHGNLYVIDWGNSRIQRFDIDRRSNF